MVFVLVSMVVDAGDGFGVGGGLVLQVTTGPTRAYSSSLLPCGSFGCHKKQGCPAGTA